MDDLGAVEEAVAKTLELAGDKRWMSDETVARIAVDLYRAATGAERLRTVLRETIGIMKMWQRDPDSAAVDLTPVIQEARAALESPVAPPDQPKPEE